MKMLRAFVRAAWTICKKDLRVWLRQPANVAITVLPALALLFVDALSAGAVGRSPVALVTLAQGPPRPHRGRVFPPAAPLPRAEPPTPPDPDAFNTPACHAILTPPPSS